MNPTTVSTISNLFSTHDPLQNLASLFVRQAFGSTVQLVADALHSRGEQTLSQLVAYLKKRLLHPHQPASATAGGNNPLSSAAQQRGRRLGVVSGRRPCPTDKSSVRAALIVLLQHDIVSVRVNRPEGLTAASAVTCYYSVRPAHARRLFRYAKYVEFLRKVVLVGDDVASGVLQALLLAGRLRTMDWLVQSVRQRQSHQAVADPRYTVRQQVVEAAHKLESLGFAIPVAPLSDEEADGEECEFEGDRDEAARSPSPKRPRIDADSSAMTNEECEDPALFALLQGSAHYKHAFPLDRVWKVNIPLFHAYMRAYQLGRMVAERYGHKVQSCGSLVTAALKFQAQRQHNPNERAKWSQSTHMSYGFSTNEIVKHVPKPVLQILEKKVGGVSRSLPKAFEDLMQVTIHPVVVQPLTSFSAGDRPSGGDASPRFELRVDALTEYLYDRVAHQIVHDRHGLVAARVVSILTRHGYLESESLAEHAMVPVKDVREVLHQLYKSRYVEMVQLPARPATSSSSQNGPGGASASASHGGGTHLWGVLPSKLRSTLTEHAAKALWNLQWRRQHELRRGEQWVLRAQQARAGDADDENEHEKDRLNYTKFCLGLERLDVASLQLDDALLVLGGFR